MGPTLTSAELLFIQIKPADSAATVHFKRTMLSLLVHAQATGRQVDVGHPDTSAEVTSVGTAATSANQKPLQMDGVEVTQSVQDLDHSVPLVANKRTVVRLYLSYYASPGVTVRGEISVRRGPSDPPLRIPSLNTVVLDPALAGYLTFTRDDVNRSLNFLLPATHTVEGPLNISIASITDVASGAPLEVGGERRPTVRFHAGSPLRLRVLRMRYTTGNPPVTYTPSLFDYQALVSWLGRAYPTHQVIASEAIVDVAGSPFDSCAGECFGCSDVNAQLAAIRALDMNAGADQRTHYYGLVSDGAFFMRGCAAGIPFTPDPGTVASGPTGPADWGWDFDGSYGDWYGGHELGHTFGRFHPGFCGESPDDLSNYPSANGQLANTSVGFAGFDVGDPALNLPMVALPGTQWHDVMTYCNSQWLSAYSYRAVRERLFAEDRLGSGAGASLGASAGTGGRPDERFPQRRANQFAAEQRSAEQPGSKIVIHVVAKVNLTRSQGKFLFVNPVPNLPVSPAEQNSPVLLRVRRPDGEMLHEVPVSVRLSSELSPDEDRVGLVDTVIAVDPAARVIDLVIARQVVDTFRAGGEPPALQGVNPVRSAGQELGLQF
ncbi:MAG TPA: hypothetical protein VK899_02180, partial [Gemmatimonadales bacterium]|nr:hypothetical protein [Gemmatimonadales bacterium]